MTTEKTVPAAGRVARVGVAGLLCVLIAGCGSPTPGGTAVPAPVPSLAPTADCGRDRTTDDPTDGKADPLTDEGTGGYAGPPTHEESSGYAGPPTDEETGGYPGPPTDKETGGYPGPPTDEETGGYAGPPTDAESSGYPGPPTDEESSGYPGPPTDEETGGYPGPPTDEETGGYAGPRTDQETGGPARPPTDGPIGHGGGPCGPADWFDMTRDFRAYLDQHLTRADDGTLIDGSVQEARVRKVSAAGEARITFDPYVTDDAIARPGAVRLAQVFADWRREVYGDTGSVSVRTTDGTVLVTRAW